MLERNMASGKVKWFDNKAKVFDKDAKEYGFIVTLLPRGPALVRPSCPDYHDENSNFIGGLRRLLEHVMEVKAVDQ